MLFVFQLTSTVHLFSPRPTPVFKSEKVLANAAAKDCAEVRDETRRDRREARVLVCQTCRTVILPNLLSHPPCPFRSQPMGWTSENVGRDFDIAREKADRLAVRSHNRAEEATKSGKFLQEILPVKAIQVNAETGEKTEIVVDKDDGMRFGTTYEALAKGRPAFPQWGNISTGGNSSQVTDGAAAAFLMTRRKAEELGLKPIARHVATQVVGVTPKYMVSSAQPRPQLANVTHATKLTPSAPTGYRTSASH